MFHLLNVNCNKIVALRGIIELAPSDIFPIWEIIRHIDFGGGRTRGYARTELLYSFLFNFVSCFSLAGWKPALLRFPLD